MTLNDFLKTSEGLQFLMSRPSTVIVTNVIYDAADTVCLVHERDRQKASLISPDKHLECVLKRACVDMYSPESYAEAIETRRTILLSDDPFDVSYDALMF